ncbi:hypothetical protein KUCAC02_007885 [Chaenocephalus aceratus]|uniref:Uncharacterized protein n=1 Tax=Chaenocephalus aceratus TaxID=36190 RepID=A0ACB9X806_CHAAC|nr:hypothetical protein KUCAC02_007885 [Chaenocephalus aceratus]
MHETSLIAAKVFSGASWQPPRCATTKTPPDGAPGRRTRPAWSAGTGGNRNITMKTYRKAVRREAPVALRVPNNTSRNNAEKYTTSSPILQHLNGIMSRTVRWKTRRFKPLFCR